ncbi:MAG: 3-isopropylmalate dehydratase small subunit [bacterium]|nr:3-isopropylmalate dehydratase small subunit [bacterium]
MSLERKVISGRAVPIRGNEVDTDRIIPARFLKEITFERMGDFLFQDARFNEDGSEKKHPLNDAHYKGANIMVVENNFGCGSSREHAPQSILRYGIVALIGESFAEIFAGNCKALGVPTLSANKSDIQMLLATVEADPSATLTLDVDSRTVRIQSNGKEDVIQVTLPDARRQSFLDGSWDELGTLKGNLDKIKETAASNLPYFTNFT